MAIQRPLELNVRRTATDFNKILCRQVNEKKNERNIPVKPTLDTDFLLKNQLLLKEISSPIIVHNKDSKIE